MVLLALLPLMLPLVPLLVAGEEAVAVGLTSGQDAIPELPAVVVRIGAVAPASP